jgi:hypothetical protein
MVFKLLEAARKSWRRLDGTKQLRDLDGGQRFPGFPGLSKPITTALATFQSGRLTGPNASLIRRQ